MKRSGILTASQTSKKAIEKAAPRLHIYQAEKDQTDLDLALSWAVGQRPSCIRMFGISGGRADHFLGNLHLLYTAMKQNVKTVMIDRQNTISMHPKALTPSCVIKQNRTFHSCRLRRR